MKTRLAVAISAVWFFNLPAWSAELSASQLFKRVSPTIVVIDTYDAEGKALAQGSGVTIGAGRVVTNCHVFKEADRATVSYQDRDYPSTLRYADTERDLCEISVSGLSAPAAILGSTSGVQVGDKTYAIGAPSGFTLTLSDGLISSIRPVLGGSVLQTTAAISPGSSGGGLFDATGRLIGITTMYYKDSPQLNFAVPVEWISQLPHRRVKLAEEDSDATSKEQSTALLELKALREELEANDPEGYARRLPELKKIVATIASLPPSQWEQATRRAYTALIAKEMQLRNSTSMAPDPQKATSHSPNALGSSMLVENLRIGLRLSPNAQLVENDIFLPSDTIHAIVRTEGRNAGFLAAQWRYGNDSQLVSDQFKSVEAGIWDTNFEIFHPDGWPVGVYSFTLFLHQEKHSTKSFCVQDDMTVCRRSQRTVYAYTNEGAMHYTSKPPPASATDRRDIRYSFFTLETRSRGE